MSARKALPLRAAAALEAGDLDSVGEWFTKDFRLHVPAIPGWPGGHEGARRMLASIRDLLLSGLRVEALDMVEEGDRGRARCGCDIPVLSGGQGRYLTRSRKCGPEKG